MNKAIRNVASVLVACMLSFKRDICLFVGIHLYIDEKHSHLFYQPILAEGYEKDGDRNLPRALAAFSRFLIDVHVYLSERALSISQASDLIAFPYERSTLIVVLVYVVWKFFFMRTRSCDNAKFCVPKSDHNYPMLPYIYTCTVHSSFT